MNGLYENIFTRLHIKEQLAKANYSIQGDIEKTTFKCFLAYSLHTVLT